MLGLAPIMRLLSASIALTVCGTSSPLSAQELLWLWDGDAAGDRFGTTVAGAGDLDADGYPDLVVGANVSDAN